jgi:hypothetical protein
MSTHSRGRPAHARAGERERVSLIMPGLALAAAVIAAIIMLGFFYA